MSGIKDLRDFLAVLKDNKLLFETERAVDWKYEIGSLLATLEAEGQRTGLFHNIKDKEFSVCGNVLASMDGIALALGCRNVQVTTAIMQYGYRIVEDMANGLMHFMDERGYNKLDEFIGCALPNIIPAEELNRDFKILPKFDEEKCIGCGRCYISCYDGAHQAIDWNEEKRRPELNDNCVGCHLCLNVCPVQECITPGEIKWKEGRKQVDVTVKQHYE